MMRSVSDAKPTVYQPSLLAMISLLHVREPFMRVHRVHVDQADRMALQPQHTTDARYAAQERY